jgi:hypothetical protein
LGQSCWSHGPAFTPPGCRAPARLRKNSVANSLG